MYSMRRSCGNEAKPKIRNAAKVTTLFAVALLALPAFAGTARYVGSHTADDVRISDFAALRGNLVATYTGDTIIFTADGGLGMTIFHDEEGDTISFSDGSNPNDFQFTMVIEGVTLPDFNVDPLAWMVLVGVAKWQFDVTTWQWAYVANDAGTDVVGGSGGNNQSPKLTITDPPSFPVTYPVTLTIERSEGKVKTSAVDATNAVLDLGTNEATDASSYDARIIFADYGASPFLASMTVSLIELSGDNVPDVNVPVVTSITRTGAIDEAFTSGTAEWEVAFSDPVKNVTGDDFTTVLAGDATADAPTVTEVGGTGRVFTVTAANAGGVGATIGLNFNDGTDVVTTIGDTPIEGMVGPEYSIGTIIKPTAVNGGVKVRRK